MTNKLLDAALNYAARGWPVFPLCEIGTDKKCSCGSPSCKSPGKHPMLGSGGVNDATTNSVLIRTWWLHRPNANIGIALGTASSLWALDIDPRNGGDDLLLDLQMKNDDLPETLKAFTGGGGEHYFFKYDGTPKIRNGKFIKGEAGIDVKSTGGYVVAAPSNHASGQHYKWTPAPDVAPVVAPQWVLDILAKRESLVGSATPAQAQSILPVDLAEQRSAVLAPAKVLEITSAISHISADEYETWVSVGMALHSTCAGSQALAIWDQWSATSRKFDQSEQVSKWNSFQSDAGGLTLSTLFGMAKSCGWIDPGQAPSVIEQSIDIGALRQVEPVAPVSPVNAPTPIAEAPALPPIPDVCLRPPGVIASIADYMTRTAIRPQPLFSLVGALSLVANVIGRRYETETGLRSNLYLVSIGPTGCGKNHARSCIKRILTAAELVDNIGGEELASGQGILARAAETPNILFQLDEFGLLMKSVQNPNAGSHLAAILAILMKLFSSASDIYVGTEYANATKRPRVTINYPCVGVHATTTGETFFDALDSKHVLSGYLNRLIVIETEIDRPSRQRNQRLARDIPIVILDWCRMATGVIGDGNLSGVNPASPMVVFMSAHAAEMFDAFDDEIDGLMNATRGTGLDALWNRAWEHAAKVALVAAVGDDPTEPKIGTDHATFAIELIRWSIRCLAVQVAARVSDSPFQARTKECLRSIEAAGSRGMTEREVGRSSAFAKLTPKEREEVLQALQGAEQIERVAIVTGGRPRIAFVALAG